MGQARELTEVPLSPEEAFDLWTDLGRWPSFIDGFGHLERSDDEWPAEGAKVVWVSRPGGRGPRACAGAPAGCSASWPTTSDGLGP